MNFGYVKRAFWRWRATVHLGRTMRALERAGCVGSAWQFQAIITEINQAAARDAIVVRGALK